MQLEKEDLICNHTKETTYLRGQINWYREQFEATSPAAPAMSAAPSSTGFTDFNLEMDHLAIGDQSWDRYISVQPSDETDYLGATAESFATIQPPKQLSQQQQDTVSKNSTEQPVASGILFMLLLCGAFVASRSPSSASTLDTTQTTLIPRMPDEVRAASTEVLNNLLKENPKEASLFLPDLVSPHRYPQPPVWPQPSNIGNLHKHLTSPTAYQEAEQTFAMTAEQYNALTTYQHMDTLPPPPLSSSHRPNLAETLGRMREARGPSAAEVYTRSLLWDTVPEDVVRAFKRAVAQRAEGDEVMDEGVEGLWW
jgi:hypothetical protein